MALKIGGGEFKGRILKMPSSSVTRPSSAIFRKSIFDSCQREIAGSVVADLYAGSGVLGLEALSRGAKKAYFIEIHHKVGKCIKENIALLGVEERSVLIQGDIYSNLSKISEPLDIIFLDPPYTIGLEGYEKLFIFLEKSVEQFSKGAHIYFEISSKYASSLTIPEVFTLLKGRKSSTTTLWHLQKK